jgi:uncharacterized membrane protein
MRLLLVLLTAVAAATAVRAAQSDDAVLAQGPPFVEVRADPDGESGLIRGAIDIAAPPELVFQVVTDCDLATKMVSSLKSCRILERDPAGRWDVREQVSKMTFLPSVRSVFRSDYDPPGRVRFRRVDGDLKVYEGEWRIDPLGGGSRVSYVSRVSTPFRVPGALARIGLRRAVRQALLALRSECLAQAR